MDPEKFDDAVDEKFNDDSKTSLQDFTTSQVGDSSENLPHLTPRTEVITQGRSVEAPSGQWVDVPEGYVLAPGTYVDDEGYLRCSSNDAYAVWHNKDCHIRKVEKHEIVHDTNGAPWCPECYMQNEQTRERNKIRNFFKIK